MRKLEERATAAAAAAFRCLAARFRLAITVGGGRGGRRGFGISASSIGGAFAAMRGRREARGASLPGWGKEFLFVHLKKEETGPIAPSVRAGRPPHP